MTAMSTHLYARIESKVKSSKRIVDMRVLSEEKRKNSFRQYS